MRDNLVDDAASLPALDRYVPGLVHAAKWTVLLAISGALIGSERMYATPKAQGRMLAALAKLVPATAEARTIAAQFDAHEAEIQYQRGLAYLQSGQAGPALAPLRAAVKLDPAHFQAHLQLGDALLALDKPGAAAKAFRQAMQLQPDVPDARIALADAQLKAGDLDAAEATLREGLHRQPDSPELSFTLGLLLQQRGRSAEAGPLLQRAAQGGLAPRP
jgi:Tfp pilus assembly protein PilF